MKKLGKFFLSVSLTLFLGLGSMAVLAQNKPKDPPTEAKGKELPPQTKPRTVKTVTPTPPPDEDEEDYDEEEYAVWQKASEEKDTAKRLDSLLEYVKKGKSLTLKSHSIGAFNQLYEEYNKAKNYQAIADLAEKFLKTPRDLLRNLDKEGEKAKKPVKVWGEVTYIRFIAAAADAYENLKNKPKTAEWGEKVFAEKPNKETAYILTTTYRDLKNDAKYVEWAKKTLELSPDINIATDLNVGLFRFYVGQKKNSEALKYAQQFIKTLPSLKKPDKVTDAQWNEFKNGNLVDAYTLQADELYQQNKWSQAIPLFEKVLTIDSKRDNARAFIAYSYWKMKKQNEAMDNFARCHAMKGPAAAKCRQELETLYKPDHNNTTIGIEKIYARAGVKQPH